MTMLALPALMLLCVASLIQGKSEYCKQPIVKGTCGSRLVSWAYNAATDRCVRFIYSGCGGNDNRFRTSAICKRACIDLPEKKKKK
ncbi:collagen alpha 3VI chain [Echinococcus multilocularis]|uniref:Collagen alpha 3VI chain n=1 Tax=Echinococcus multilocularis TaxID=6211 RepID=A0A068YN95_ECHMU|nr:collagen alpha 3VI chain [Echinococcus multilocularis]